MLLQNLRQEEHAVKSTEAQGGIEKKGEKWGYQLSESWRWGISGLGLSMP